MQNFITDTIYKNNGTLKNWVIIRHGYIYKKRCLAGVWQLSRVVDTNNNHYSVDRSYRVEKWVKNRIGKIKK